MSMARSQEPDPVEQAAFELEQDEISGVIEMDGMYYILKCTNAYDQEATQKNKEILAQEKKSQAFQSIYHDFASGIEMEFDQSVWEKASMDGSDGCSTDNFFSMYWDYFGQ